MADAIVAPPQKKNYLHMLASKVIFFCIDQNHHILYELKKKAFYSL